MCPVRYLSLFIILVLVRLSLTAEGILCEIPKEDDGAWGSSPLRFNSTETLATRRFPQCVSMHIRLRPEDFKHTTNHARMIIILSSGINITIKKSGLKIKWRTWDHVRKIKGICPPTCRNNHTMCELNYSCVKAEAGSSVSASFIGSINYTEKYNVPDPVPQFHLSVAPGSRKVNVTLAPGPSVYTILCYRNENLCKAIPKRITIDPSKSLSATLNVSYLLPCVCVQVYYTHSDAKRVMECPFANISLEARDVWLSSEFKLYTDHIAWTSRCSSSYLQPSAALCWKNDTGLCTPILNSRLAMINSSSLLYNISTLDKHSQMCLQFSIKNNRHVHCPFKSDKGEWEARVGPGGRSMSVHLTSYASAIFSAQLCILQHSGCHSVGDPYSGTTDGSKGDLQLNLPVHTIAERPCVQVWQSAPARLGKRILCPEYTHRRSGMLVAAALLIGVLLALLAFVVYKVTKSGTTGWLSIHKPVLLVCSSGQPAHVSAACALASILQGELCAAVRMALWSQSSDRQAGAGAGSGVADLGPLPWLYGEWDAVQQAQGKLLVVWSPEAKRVFERTTEQETQTERRKREGTRKVEATRGKATDTLDGEEGWRTIARTLTYGTEKDALLEGDDPSDVSSEGSSITGPVLRATLARLKGVLREPGRSHPVVLISLRGLNHNRDIPDELRGVPRYSLPGDFRGLIQELGGIVSGPNWEELGCDCWPRLRSKVLLLWLARRLSHQLKTWLP
ncbi:interleukin-17 receptor E isoform X2 [Gadus morhua]|uniref:interleukin-17 receptor E isoform X2 n=1 Tax=Gadus morhua TaxID=8049 RepID=UPI0011B85CAE|nr:interleukin-17 receptor E-like isoform X2 [Gadus morhua]